MAYDGYKITTEVTKSDTARNEYKALWIGTGGNVNIHDKAGNTAYFNNISGSTILPVKTT
jgi:hypothetical protein